MRHPLYDELRTLTDNPHVIAAINTADISGAPAELLRGLEKTVSIMPEIPTGKRFSKECFWGKFQAKFIWHTAWHGPEVRKDSAEKWLRTRREEAQTRGQEWPPKPVFIPVSTTPDPWDGRNEKPGNVPRDGKETFNIFKKKL